MCSVEGILFRKYLCETEASNIVIINGYKIRKNIVSEKSVLVLFTGESGT